MKIITLYHQVQRDLPCPDGLAAAWVVQKRFPPVGRCHYAVSRRDLILMWGRWRSLWGVGGIATRQDIDRDLKNLA